MSTNTIEGYREFLHKCGGEADLLNRRLANRERYFENLIGNPIRSANRADRAAFTRNLHRRLPERGLDGKMLFLLATAKLTRPRDSASASAKRTGRTATTMCHRSGSI